MNYGVKSCVWTALGDISANFIQGSLVIFFIGSFFSDKLIVFALKSYGVPKHWVNLVQTFYAGLFLANLFLNQHLGIG